MLLACPLRYTQEGAWQQKIPMTKAAHASICVSGSLFGWDIVFGRFILEEIQSNSETARKNNMRIFWNGALIAVLGSALILFGVSCLDIRRGHWTTQGWIGRYIEFSTGGLLIDYLSFIFFSCVRVFGVAVVQLIILLIFNILSRRNIEVSGAKKWIFYAFEIVIAFTPILLRGFI